MELTWKQRIGRAEKTGEFTQEDESEASGFLTCAVGERAERIQELTLHDWSPEFFKNDTLAHELGMDFFRAINNNDIKKTRKLYNKIQKLKFK